MRKTLRSCHSLYDLPPWYGLEMNSWILIIPLLLSYATAWDNYELELFDLVEDINRNFYEFLDVAHDASSSDIRKAYRRLSLQLHPDRNKAEDAEEQFRQLNSVYEVLKDDQKRSKYDHILEFGLPDWRQPVYYFRKVRKIGLLETGLLVFVIFTVGHFLVIWAAYLEKRFEMEELLKSKKKKERKLNRKNKSAHAQDQQEDDALDELLETLPRPRLTDLLPLKCFRGLRDLTLAVVAILREVHSKRSQPQIEEPEEEETAAPVRRRQRVDLHLDQAPGAPLRQAPVVYTPLDSLQKLKDAEESAKQAPKNHPWGPEDDALLAKAMAKFPGGTAQRWPRIAAILERPVVEVIAKAKAAQADMQRHVDAAAQGITGKDHTKVQHHLQNVQISTRVDNHNLPPANENTGWGHVANSTANQKSLSAIANKNEKKKESAADVADANRKASNKIRDIKQTSNSNTIAKNNIGSKNTQNEITSSKKSHNGNCDVDGAVLSHKLSYIDAEISQSHNKSQGSIKPNKTGVNASKGDSKSKQETTSISNKLGEKPTLGDSKGASAVLAAPSSMETSPAEAWTQTQQKCFEWALTHYPKGTAERWDKIAVEIPGKSKDDCIARFKYLVSIVQQRKKQQTQQ